MNLLVDRKAQDVNINVVLLGGAVTLARVYLFFFYCEYSGGEMLHMYDSAH